MKNTEVNVSSLPNAELFNLEVSYNEELQEIPKDLDSMKAYADQCMAWINDEMNQPESNWNMLELVDVMGKTANHYKQLCELEQAQDLIQTSLFLIEKQDLGLAQFMIQSLRWADIFRYLGEYGQCEEVLLDLMDITEANVEASKYQDFVWQNLGLLYFDLEELDLAEESFMKVLELRKTSEYPELFKATEFLLKTTRERKLR